MKKSLFLFLVFLAILSTSCTKRWCNSHYPATIDSVLVIKDSVHIILKDTTVNVYLPGLTVIDSVIIPCAEPPAAYIPDTAYAETPFSKALAWFSYPSIRLKLIQKDTTLAIRLNNAIRDSYYWHSEFNRVTKILEKKHIPNFYRFCTFAFIGICIAFIIYIVLKVFKI